MPEAGAPLLRIRVAMASAPSYLNPPPRQWPDPGEWVKDGKAINPLIFHGCDFRKPIDLAGVTFEAGVSFRRCIFHEAVNFSGARFRGCASFWRSVFEKQADFKYADFEQLETGAPGSVFNGEANFSWSRFEQDVDFLWARFEGPVFSGARSLKNSPSSKLHSIRTSSSKEIPVWSSSSGGTSARIMEYSTSWKGPGCCLKTTKTPTARNCHQSMTDMLCGKGSRASIWTATASTRSCRSWRDCKRNCFLRPAHLSAGPSSPRRRLSRSAISAFELAGSQTPIGPGEVSKRAMGLAAYFSFGRPPPRRM